MMDQKKPQVVPAPWQLKGTGYMFLYNFPKNWASKANFMPVEQMGEFQGGLGTLMLVDYESSDVGPYRELLLIPGKFSWLQYRNYAISRIWVSSETSVVSGRKNWGIPKHRADFRITARGSRRQSWEVLTPEGQTFFKADLSHGLFPVPVHTALVPFPLPGPLRQAESSGNRSGAFSGYHAQKSSARIACGSISYSFPRPADDRGTRGTSATRLSGNS
jgi:hypothetical protein